MDIGVPAMLVVLLPLDALSYEEAIIFVFGTNLKISTKSMSTTARQLPKPALMSEKKSSNTFVLEGAVDYLMDPVSGNNAKNRQVHGAFSSC